MKPYIKIPTYNAGTWEYTTFNTKDDFREFVKGLFKEPGKYNFDETSNLFNEHARTFNKKKLFCEAPELSRDYIDYWDTEKEKCRKGVIFKNGKGDTWYLPRFLYHWWNFLQIYFKVAKKFDFPEVRDIHYHMALYEALAELHDKNIAVLKKRQVASSYFHVAKLYNRYIFEDGFVGKMVASDKKYIDATNGSWKFLNQYHNFTNMHTAWACTNMPDKVFSWQQKIETKTADGRKVQIGTMATITGVSMDKDPVSGVGGATDELFYEEGGVAPTADITYGYMRQAMREGALTSGVFTIAGSVGDLSQCNPLKEFIDNPEDNDFYAVDTTLIDENGTPGKTALFIPEQWGMPPYIDEFGNSKVEEAMDYLDKEYGDLKKKMPAAKYQLEVSQRPRNIKEAFAIRTVSVFPVKHTAKQIKSIEDKEVFVEYVDLERTDENKIVCKKSDKQPNPFPISKSEQDKRGVICIHERPIEDNTWGTYYASIDPVEVGKTNTSDSLAAIYIYKNPIEVTKTEKTIKRIDGIEEELGEPVTTTFLEGDKLVAWWCGRFDDVNETNELMSKIVEYYNAWTICENQKTSFINYMISKRRQKYLAQRTDMLFDKELEVKQNVYQQYGWSKSQRLWGKMLEYGINYLSEELNTETDKDGTITKIHYGVERIPDIWLLKEMQQYNDKGNFDRVIAYTALIAFAKVQQATRGVKKRVERTDDELFNPQKFSNFKVDRSPFTHIGRSGSAINQKSRKAFKHIR